MEGTIIAFNTHTGKDRVRASKFAKLFYGQETSSHKGRYRYRREGLLDSIPHIRLIRGVVIVSKNDADRVVHFLKENRAEFFARDVILLPEDEEALRP